MRDTYVKPRIARMKATLPAGYQFGDAGTIPVMTADGRVYHDQDGRPWRVAIHLVSEFVGIYDKSWELFPGSAALVDRQLEREADADRL